MQRLYYTLYDSFEGPVAPLHTGGAFYFVGPLDVGALAQSFTLACSHHQALAARLHVEDGIVEQTFDGPPPELARTDLTSLPADERLREATRIVDDCRTRVFALADGDALVRGHLVSLASDEAVLVVSDLRSIQVLHDTILAFYRHLVEGTLPPPAPPRFADYLQSELAVRGSASFQPNRAFWGEWLKDPTWVGPPPKGAALDCFEEPLEDDFRELVVAEAKRFGVRNYAVLLGRYARALDRWGGHRDLTVGVIVLNREPKFADVFGCLAQWLPVRVRLEPDSSPEAAARRCHAAFSDATTHALPLGEIAGAVKRSRMFDLALCANWMPGVGGHTPLDTGAQIVELAREITPQGRQRFPAERIGDLEAAQYLFAQRMSQFTLGFWTYPKSIVCHFNSAVLSGGDARAVIRTFTAR
jgi:hypothetical protein